VHSPVLFEALGSPCDARRRVGQHSPRLGRGNRVNQVCGRAGGRHGGRVLSRLRPGGPTARRNLRAARRNCGLVVQRSSYQRWIFLGREDSGRWKAGETMTTETLRARRKTVFSRNLRTSDLARPLRKTVFLRELCVSVVGLGSGRASASLGCALSLLSVNADRRGQAECSSRLKHAVVFT